MPALERLGEELGVGRDDGLVACDAVLVGTGPGSYTGLRVGIATALGIARGTGAVLRGVPSVEALAWAELRPGTSGAVALDARAERFYFAAYGRSESDVETLVAPRLARAAELPALLAEADVILGDETVARAAAFGPRELERLRIDATPRADAILELGLARLAQSGPHAPAELEPLYLRAFGER